MRCSEPGGSVAVVIVVSRASGRCAWVVRPLRAHDTASENSQRSGVSSFLLNHVCVRWCAAGSPLAESPRSSPYQRRLDCRSCRHALGSSVQRREEWSSREIWTRSRLGTHAEVITDTVKVLEDGKDVTEQGSEERRVGKECRSRW